MMSNLPRTRFEGLLNEPKPIGDVQDNSVKESSKFVIERVVIARKMTELASDLERREEILRNLETAHIKSATKALTAGNDWRSFSVDEVLNEEARMEQLIKVLGPFVDEFELQDPFTTRSKTSISQHALNKLLPRNSVNPNEMTSSFSPSSPQVSRPGNTICFQNQIVPSLDYWTTRLKYVTTLVKEHHDKSLTSFEPVSTAFVAFSDPADARRACRWLAAHPNTFLVWSLRHPCVVTQTG